MSETMMVGKLPVDLRKAAATLGRDEARYLVDLYYTMQGHRMASNNQARDLFKSDEPHATIAFFGNEYSTVEAQIKAALSAYASAQPLGQWALKNYGIGPVITAGLLAHIDIEKAPTVGHIWRFAGLDPTITWGKGEKRPFNASLKVLCWKIGESFKKFSNKEDCQYGKVYKNRKIYEVERNDAVEELPVTIIEGIALTSDTAKDGVASELVRIDNQVVTAYRIPQGRDGEVRWFYGGNAKWAATTLATKKIQDADTLARYRAGKLPDGRLDLRASRYAAKLFLSHYHHEAYVLHYGKQPPNPYPIAILGHTHYIAPDVPHTKAA